MTEDSPYVRSFDSTEEMFDFLRENQERLDASLTDEQRALTWGSYFIVPEAELMVFGYCFTYEQQEQSERYSYGYGRKLSREDEAEFRATMDMARRGHEGRMFTRCYSIASPTGELGYTHRATAWPISQDQFVAALLAQWNPVHPMVRSWLEPQLNSVARGGENSGTSDRR